jgi:hypothetical protein
MSRGTSHSSVLLPRAGLAADHRHAAGRHHERHVVQCHVAARVAQRDAVQLDGTGELTAIACVPAVVDAHRGLQNFEHAFAARRGLGRSGGHARDLAHRAEQGALVGEEHEQAAGGELAARHGGGADHQGHRGARRRQQVERCA